MRGHQHPKKIIWHWKLFRDQGNISIWYSWVAILLLEYACPHLLLPSITQNFTPSKLALDEYHNAFFVFVGVYLVFGGYIFGANGVITRGAVLGILPAVLPIFFGFLTDLFVLPSDFFWISSWFFLDSLLKMLTHLMRLLRDDIKKKKLF